MAYKNEEINLRQQYYDIFSVLQTQENTHNIWDYMEFSERKFWWVICWNLSNERIEIAENLFATYDIVDLFEKYAIKLTLDYKPEVNNG
ncbi:MAG: hypothetical protein N2560_08735 [Ignavibacteria bacterium]|nr:hypothetical protein [Ignavibacteria bacterium]